MKDKSLINNIFNGDIYICLYYVVVIMARRLKGQGGREAVASFLIRNWNNSGGKVVLTC